MLKKGGTTQDIINNLLDVIPDIKGQTREFSRKFSADKAGMRNLWTWVRANIRYEEDPLGVQWIREPRRLWADRVGDCKSMTLFIVSVLENLGIEYRVRFSNTEIPRSKQVNHVYPIAIIAGQEIIVDAVYPLFNTEKSFFFAKDYTMSDIYRLSGIGAAQLEEAEKYALEIQTIAADIPDDVLDNDITEMSAGEFARWQAAEKFDAQAVTAQSDGVRAKFSAAAQAVRSGNISGIGAIAPTEAKKIEMFLRTTQGQTKKAFSAPVLVIPDALAGDIGRIGKLTDIIKNAWKKIMNWIFKLAMPGAAMFFLYSFIKKSVGKKTAKRKAGQDRVLGWIQNAGKFDSKDAVLQAAKTGIIKQTGKTPEALLNEAAKGQNIAGVGRIGVLAAVAIKAISFVIEIITKIASLFKKKKTEVNKEDAADLSELATEAAANGKSGQNITNSTASDTGGMGFVPIAIAAGLALVVLAK